MSQNTPIPSPPRPDRKIAELFLHQNPPTFTGAGGPAEAEDWVKTMEKIFKLLECSDKECLSCISVLLRGPADYWWESWQKTLTPEQRENFTWDWFKEELYAEFIPRSYRKQKEIELMNAKQGKKSVAEYDHEFCNLARDAPHTIEADEKMTELFRSWLRQEIRVVLAAQPSKSYAETSNRALDTEMGMPTEKTTLEPTPALRQNQTPPKLLPQNQGFKGKRKRKNKQIPNKKQGQIRQEQFKPSFQGRSQSSQHRQGIPTCSRCNRVHFGPCRWGSNCCYVCGQVGHYSYNCPYRPRLPGKGKRPNPSQSTQPVKAIIRYPQFQQQIYPTLVFQPQNAPPPQLQIQPLPQQTPQYFQQQPQYQRVSAFAQRLPGKNSGNLTGTGRINVYLL